MDKVSHQELEYLRAHIREAISADRIVCLECGAQFRKLGRHLTDKHAMSLEDYRAGWGYNRLTGLACGELLEGFRAKAKARGLGTRNTREMALEALRAREARGRISLRREALERLRERPAKGQGVGPPRKISDEDLIALSNERLSLVRIARLKGMGRVSIWKRLARLKARGIPVPSRQRE
ncbi:MAG: MucR family transcriptional regulator [Acidobacteria bacterium]|nr:MucR family transcriptional regulator [Acidobacteriota bacterium]